MPRLKTIIPAKPRVGRRRRRPPTAAVAGLALVGATASVDVGDDLVVVLVFDATAEAPLADVGDAVAAKWSARFGGVRYAGYQVNLATFDSLQLLMAPGTADAGSDEIDYANDPSDIADVNGRQLAALSGFPLVNT